MLTCVVFLITLNISSKRGFALCMVTFFETFDDKEHANRNDRFHDDDLHPVIYGDYNKYIG